MAPGTIRANTSRAITGWLHKALQEQPPAWVPRVSSFNPNANQPDGEHYRFTEESPSMRKWEGPRQAHELSTQGVIVISDEYEATLEVKRRELRVEKTGQLRQRINEMGMGAARRHWAQLLFPLVANAASSAAVYGAGATYDGVNFVGATHRGSQSNAVAASAATPANPTIAELSTAVFEAVKRLVSFTDKHGEPMNEGMQGVFILGPTQILPALTGLLSQTLIQGSGGTIENLVRTQGRFMFDGMTETRLDAVYGAANKIAVFRADAGQASALIRQEEEGIVIDALAEGSAEEVMNNRHVYGVRNTRGVGYGRWEHMIEVTFS